MLSKEFIEFNFVLHVPTIHDGQSLLVHRNLNHRICTQNETDGRIMDIDVVYLWANSTDPEFIFNKRESLRFVNHSKFVVNKSSTYIPSLNGSIDFGDLPEQNVFSPTYDHGELRLSLRSLYKYNTCSWLRNIYIVTNDNQYPNWLNLKHSNVYMVNANKLIIKCVNKYQTNFELSNQLNKYGTFNSHSIYLCLHLIENISTIFMQLDDDFIFNQPIELKDIYNYDEQYEVNYLLTAKRNDIPHFALPKQEEITNKLCKYKRDGVLVRWASHRPRVWNKTTVNKIWQLFPLVLLNTVFHPFRSRFDIDLTSFYPIFQDCAYNITRNIISRDTINSLRVNYNTLDAYIERTFRIKNSNNIKYWLLQDDMHEVDNINTFIPISVIKYLFLLPQMLELFTTPFESHKYLQYQRNHIFKTSIMGHRGVGFTQIHNRLVLPENTLDNFKFAVENGVYFIECDIALTSDNIVIVHHSHTKLWEGCRHENIDHTEINLLTYQQLTTSKQYAYNINNNTYFISSLYDILSWANQTHSDIVFQIELKQHTNYGLGAYCNDNINDMEKMKLCHDKMYEKDELIEGLVNVIYNTNYPINQIIVSSFEAPRLMNFKRVLEYKYDKTVDIRLALITGTNHGRKLSSYQADKLLNAILYWNVTDISVFNQAITQQFIHMCKLNNIYTQIGMPGGGYCIHEINQLQIDSSGDDYRMLFDALMYNADIICTNQPILAQSIMFNISHQYPIFQF